MKNRSVDSIFNPAAERLCTGKEANDLMNDYFINIGNDLASNLPTCNTGYDHDDTCSTSLPVFEELTKDHLLKILKKISITKSSGLEEINTRILVDAFTSIPELLVKFYNLSLKNSQIPACLKISKVTPLPKKGDVTLLNNLRPTSNTPLPTKILEKHVNKQIYEYMESNKLFFMHQNGFRKGKSTIRAVNNIANKLYEYKNNGEYSIDIFLDLSKAFNCVNHDILCMKLEKVGIKGQCKQWIMEYLRDRQQYVRNGGINSDCKSINYGIPQGSVLGPLIYLLYVNDIMDCDIASDLSMFADDTAMVAHGKVLADVVSQVNHDMTKLTGWFNANKLSVNLDKTKCMFFSKNAHEDCKLPILEVNGIQLKFVNNFSYVGIVLDNKLQFNDHIKNNIKKAGHIGVYVIKKEAMILPYIDDPTLYRIR